MPPLHVALTGNIASGKSTVARMLQERGATIIDADELAREAIAPGTPGHAAVVEQFGPEVVTDTGEIDRAWLRHRVFNDANARQALNSIVHPIVGLLRKRAVHEAMSRGARVIVSDIPLLYETGLDTAFRDIILVDASEATRLERLLHHRGLDESTARAMIAAQMPGGENRARATWVVDNDGSLDELEQQVAALWPALERAAVARA